MTGKFKLITGLGNKDENKVKDLVLLWMKAGADIFDMSPSILPYVQEAAINEGFDLSRYEFCVSVPLIGDIHGKKAKIKNDSCKKCGRCQKECIEGAIYKKDDNYFVDEKKCIGCFHCAKKCPKNAIELYDDMNSDFENLLKTNAKIDTLEIHISIKDKKEILKQFKNIISLLKDKTIKISVCFNRKYFSNSKTEKILSKLKKITNGREFVVQTDGNSMNKGSETLAGTIETVAFGLFVKSLGYDVILSGGTNDYTAQLAKEAGLKCSIAYGSFARKLVLGSNNNEALLIAKNFVSGVKKLINEN